MVRLLAFVTALTWLATPTPGLAQGGMLASGPSGPFLSPVVRGLEPAAHKDDGKQWVNDWVRIELTNRVVARRKARILFQRVNHPGHDHWRGVFAADLGDLPQGGTATANLPDHRTRSGDPECTPATAFDFQFKIAWRGGQTRWIPVQVPAGGSQNGTAPRSTIDWVATHMSQTLNPCDSLPNVAALQAPEGPVAASVDEGVFVLLDALDEEVSEVSGGVRTVKVLAIASVVVAVITAIMVLMTLLRIRGRTTRPPGEST